MIRQRGQEVERLLRRVVDTDDAGTIFLSAMRIDQPMRGQGTPMPPTDSLIYRFYELVMVNGPAWKALIEEEYGDGIMSAKRFRHGDGAPAEPQGRPRQDHHERQVLAVQILQRERKCAGVWVQ